MIGVGVKLDTKMADDTLSRYLLEALNELRLRF